jgi:hypothetical protein
LSCSSSSSLSCSSSSSLSCSSSSSSSLSCTSSRPLHAEVLQMHAVQALADAAVPAAGGRLHAEVLQTKVAAT